MWCRSRPAHGRSAYLCGMRTLFASKKCPVCGQWSVWQQHDDDRCEHCGELLNPQASAQAAELERLAREPVPQFMLIEIKPTDGSLLRGLKYVARGGQLAFAAIMAFILWVVTMAAA